MDTTLIDEHEDHNMVKFYERDWTYALLYNRYLSQAHITHKSNPMISSSCLTGTGSSLVNSLEGHKDCFQQMLSLDTSPSTHELVLVSKKEAEKIVRWLDSNGDGYIDLDDLLNVITQCGSEKDDLMDAFLIFDIDKNGFIYIS
ncbi:hypothetical protein POTOM_012109 [Populus tomentosa]|uniref:EF-hand domain-containing protein n=1 Tax=Populus tomentosa TaxID=118781 RepID=A0A8X8A9B4_POPTO|nr:hypothetical protein POTOM_012109 [Populus tomentosa]